MPGSKRRALKNLLSPSGSPSNTPTAQSTTYLSSIPTPDSSSSSPSHSTSTPTPTHHHHLLFGHNHQSHQPHHTPSSSSVSDLPSREESGTSIASDAKNYMSDEAIAQDLAVERMIDRGQEIGSGTHRQEDGVGNLNGGPGDVSSVPPPNVGGGMSEQPIHQARPTPQQVTAEQCAWGDGGSGTNSPNGGLGGGGKKKSSKQRFAERQARRLEALVNSAPPNDPAWSAQLERERQEEIELMRDACGLLGREIHEIAPDGHCMFNAIADQLHQIGLIPANEAADPRHTRHTAAQYMLAHPDDFIPFLPSITGEDSAGATTHDGIMTNTEFKKYCSLVEETGEWGGEREIQALSRAFSVPIHVIQRGPPTVVSHGGTADSFGGVTTPQDSAAQGDRVVRISYHKRMYGLGEHYNSLRKVVQRFDHYQ